MKIKANIILNIIFSFLLGFFIICNRFICIRLPKDINLENINLKCLFIIFILSAIIFTYYLLTSLKIIPKPNSRLSKKVEEMQADLKIKKWFNLIKNPMLFTQNY